MGIANLHDYVARVENIVHTDLRGAQVFALIENERIVKDNGYWEYSYYVAWQRDDQCGTHRVCINSNDEAMCIHGHYDLSKMAALMDVLQRAGFDRMATQ